MFDPIKDAISAMRSGEMLIIVDDEDRENEGDFVMAAEHATPEAINFMMNKGRGLICAPLGEEIVQSLNLPSMEQENTEAHGCHFTISVDYRYGTSTGISASDRSKTLVALASEESRAQDFARPGHIFPLKARKGGVLVRAGHTEAGVDMARLAGLRPAAVICEIIQDNGEMARRDELLSYAKRYGLKIISIEDLIAYRAQNESLVKREEEKIIQTAHGPFRLLRYSNPIDPEEHLLLVKGKPEEEEEALVRAHTECVEGDVFGSQACECKNKLNAAMKQINAHGSGVILYIRKAHPIKEAPKLREYGLGAQMLRELGLHKIQLLSNKDKKVIGLEGYGLKVTKQVPLVKMYSDSVSTAPHDTDAMANLSS